MERIKKAAFDLKQKLGSSDAEKLVSSVLKTNEVPLKGTFYEIADKTFSSTDSKIIFRMAFASLIENNANTIKVLRSLQLIDSLAKLASVSFVNDIKNSTNKIRAFVDYFVEGKNSEHCGVVRDLAQKLLHMLGNPDVLETERENAKKQRERSVGFSSDQYSNGNNPKNYENYEAKERGLYEPPGEWYEKAKINYVNDQKYVPPSHLAEEKPSSYELNSKNNLFTGLQFKQEIKTKNDLFKGMQFKEKNYGNEKKNDIFGVSEEKPEKNPVFGLFDEKNEKFDIFITPIDNKNFGVSD